MADYNRPAQDATEILRLTIVALHKMLYIVRYMTSDYSTFFS